MKILIVAGMIDRKLFSKIEPIVSQKSIKNVFLVRDTSFVGNKIICFSPKGYWSKFKILNEIYKVFLILKIFFLKKPDLVIGIGLIPHGMLTTIFGRLFGIKTILLLMGKNDLFLTYPSKHLIQKILFWIASLADIIGTRGEASKKWLINKGVKPSKIFIPHNIFDFNDFTPQKNSSPEYDLIYVGLFRYYKRVDLILDLVQKLVYENEMSSIKVALVGDGPLLNELLKQSKQLKIEKNIFFLPRADKKNLNTLYNKSKIFILTSQGEGLPMVLVEALSCGLPVVAFNDADISDIVHHDYNGLLCDLGDTDKFLDNVLRILTQHEIFDKLKNGALGIREDKKEEYSLDYITELWFNILERNHKDDE